jgi:hypothetical protein
MPLPVQSIAVRPESINTYLLVIILNSLDNCPSARTGNLAVSASHKDWGIVATRTGGTLTQIRDDGRNFIKCIWIWSGHSSSIEWSGVI